MSKKGFHWPLLVVILGAIGLIWFFPRPSNELVISAGQRTRVETVAFSSDGKTIALPVYSPWKTPEHTTELQLRDAQTGVLLKTLPLSHSNGGIEVSFLSDGQTVAIGSGGVKLWNFHTDAFTPFNRGPYKDIPKGFGPVTALGNEVALTDRISLWLWNKQHKRMTQIHTSRAWAWRAQAFSPDGKIMASGDDRGTVRLWDTHSRRLLHTLTGHKKGVSIVTYSPDGKTLASGDGIDVSVWDVRTGGLMRTLTPPHKVIAVVFSPDGKTLASGGPKLDTSLFSKGIIGSSSAKHQTAPKTVGEVRLWDVQTGQLLQTLKGSHSVYDLAFAPDGKALAHTSFDDTVRVWRLQ